MWYNKPIIPSPQKQSAGILKPQSVNQVYNRYIDKQYIILSGGFDINILDWVKGN